MTSQDNQTLTGRTITPSPTCMPVVVHNVVIRYDYARAERAIVRVHGCLQGVKVTFADGRRRPRRVTKKLKARFGIRQYAAARFVRSELTP